MVKQKAYSKEQTHGGLLFFIKAHIDLRKIVTSLPIFGKKPYLSDLLSP